MWRKQHGAETCNKTIKHGQRNASNKSKQTVVTVPTYIFDVNTQHYEISKQTVFSLPAVRNISSIPEV